MDPREEDVEERTIEDPQDDPTQYAFVKTGSPYLVILCQYLGLASAISAVCIGTLSILTSGARLRWPARVCKVDVDPCPPDETYNFLDDINRDDWRFTIFSFTPSVFVDVWTPFVLGVIGICIHFGKIPYIQNFIHYMAFNIVLALFGLFGYAGGLGVLLGILPLVSAFFCLICYFKEYNDDVSLKLMHNCGKRAAKQRSYNMYSAQVMPITVLGKKNILSQNEIIQ